MNHIDTTHPEQGEDTRPQHDALERRAYETPRVVTDQVFVNLDCSEVDETLLGGCLCPGE